MKPVEARHFKPGQKCRRSGQYSARVQKVKGGQFRHAGQITISEGETFPPYSLQGIRAVRYVLTDATRHRGDA